MKKIVCILTLIALTLSLFGCRKMPEEKDDVIVDNIKTETNAEQNTDNTDNTDNTSATPDSQSDTSDSFAPAKLSIKDEFRPYEVVITLTKEETALNKYYTVEDFPELDIFHIFLQDEYYIEYPQYKEHRTIIALLNRPSKERVLEYCDKLENDPRVAFARPNTRSFSNEMWIFPSKDIRQMFRKLRKEDFPEIEAKKIVFHHTFRHPCLKWELDCDSKDDLAVIEQIRLALSSDNIDYVEPTYEPYGISENPKYHTLFDDYFIPDDEYVLLEKWPEYPYGK